MEDFTPRNLAKEVVTAYVAYKVTGTAANAVADYTSHEKDEFIVQFGTSTIGGFVAKKLKPHTDKVVDKTADFINTKRALRAAKKNTPEEK